MPILIYLGISDRNKKRLKAVFANPKKTIHFGYKGGYTYIDGASKETRENYIKRHQASKTENWDNPLTAGSLSRYILWGDSQDINKNIKKFINKFGIEDNRKK